MKLLIAVLLLVSLQAAAAPSRPMSELRQIVSDAIAAKATRLVIPPGEYRGAPEKGGRIHLAIRSVSDLEIVADGVTMICTQTTRAIDIRDCSNLTLRGLTVDYDPLPFTQGEIVTVNPAENWLDVKIHAGYPVEPFNRIDIVDRQTRYRKQGKPYMWGATAAVRPAGVVRVTSHAAAGFAQVGDLASLGGYGVNVIPHAVVVDDSTRVTLRNVTVHASNCMGIIASGGQGGHTFAACRIVPGPPPPGATEPRILSVCADAILTGTMLKGVLTEGCEIRDAGDDSWSVQSSDYVILKREGRTLWLASRDALALKNGDRLQAALGGPVATLRDRAVVRTKDTAIPAAIMEKLGSAGRWGYWRLSQAFPDGSVCKVALDADVPWKEGDSVYDIDAQGNGFVFRNNIVRSSGRILIKASGLIENNRIEGPFAISVSPEAPYPAAAGIAEVVIRNNTIIDAHMFNPFWDSPQAGAISVTSEDDAGKQFRPAGVFGKIVIENNTIEGGNGAGIVVTSAGEVAIRGNGLVRLLHIPPNNTGGKYQIDNHAAVWLAQCGHVVLNGNELVTPGPEMSQSVVRGPGVSNVEGDFSKK